VHIFNECQKYGLDILDDGIYKDDYNLGQVWLFTASGKRHFELFSNPDFYVNHFH
jgi:hypothetical protein